MSATKQKDQLNATCLVAVAPGSGARVPGASAAAGEANSAGNSE